MLEAAVEEVRQLDGTATAVVIIAHGGATTGKAGATRLRLTYAWSRAFSRWVLRAVDGTPAQVWRLRYRHRGWNGTDQDAAVDLRWAVRRAAERYPGRPVILIGHSMGGRACIYAADEPNVTAALLLAPWIEPGDPIGRLSGRSVLIAHGSRDRMTDPRASARTADAVNATFVPIPGAGHTMLDKFTRWRDITQGFLRTQVDAAG
jgi:pimeloyl-ACP methyl ester carboxylesterase